MSNAARYSALRKPAPGDPTRPVLSLTFRGHRRDVCRAVFAPTGGTAAAATAVPPRLLTASADGAVMLWDARPTNRALRFLGHRGPVLGCDYGPSPVAGSGPALLASCGLDGYARLWVPNLRRTSTTYPGSFQTQQQQQQQGSAAGEGGGATWRAHTGAARAIQFAQDGSSHLYTCGDDKSVKSWDLNYVAGGSHYPSGEPLVTFRGARFLGSFNSTAGTNRSNAGYGHNSNAHTNWVRCMAIQRSAASGSFSHYLASGGDDNVVTVWDTRNPHAGPVHIFYEHRASVRGVALHDNGFHLASCDASGVVNLFDMRRSSASASASPAGERRGQRYGLVQHYADAHGAGGIAVNEVCFAPSSSSSSSGRGGSSWLLSAGDDGTAKLWETAEAFLYCTVQAHTGAVRTVSFTDDGAHFVTAGADGVAMVWSSELTRVRQQQRQSQHEQAWTTTTTTAAAALAVQDYSYYGDTDDEEAHGEEEVRAAGEHRRPVHSDVAAAARPRTRAPDGVDPTYAAWQRSRSLATDGARAESKKRKEVRPSQSSSSLAVEGGDSPRPPGAGRPPLRPRAASAEHPSSGQHAATLTAGAEVPVDGHEVRERSFERSEERYSHISSPQREPQLRAKRLSPDQGSRSAKNGVAAATATAAMGVGRRVSFEAAGRGEEGRQTDADDVKEQEEVQRREKHIALSERRLENVENAVASLVEYVQEENAHRDRELARVQEEIGRRHGKQREEMLALKGMMEQLIAQQAMLLGRLSVDAAPAKSQQAPATAEASTTEAEVKESETA